VGLVFATDISVDSLVERAVVTRVCWQADTSTETYRREASTGRSACATKRKYDRMPGDGYAENV